MTQEEKARAYDEAIERARKWYSVNTNEGYRGIFEDIFPELTESEDEKIRKALLEMVHDTTGDELWIDYDVHKEDALAWLEKQGNKPTTMWHDVSEKPDEMRELLVEWDSEDATWHEVAFYGATTKSFNVYGKQLEGVTRWCYIDDLIEKQSEQKPQRMVSAEAKEALYDKPKWTEEDKQNLNMALDYIYDDYLCNWLKQKIEEQ